MTSREFVDRLEERLHRAGAELPGPAIAPIEAYYRLLERWNARINLTSLPLASPTDETFDRLLVEPIVAAPFVGDSPQIWFDLGSGGGSPALPLKILRPRAKLTMVESRSRKAAFLREAARVLGLADVHVENARFEKIAAETPRIAHLVTARAVRGDRSLFGSAVLLLQPRGRLLLFHSDQPVTAPERFKLIESALLTASKARLSVLEPVFHVEHTRPRTN